MPSYSRKGLVPALILSIVALGLSACGNGARVQSEPPPVADEAAGQQTSVEPTLTPAPLVSPENPVTANDQWTPVIEEFDGVEMALVPVGCFPMGSTQEELEFAFQMCEDATGEGSCGREWFEREGPRHEQCIDEPFWIDVTEVTNAQYGSEGCFSGADRPRECVTWFDAAAHCARRGARLPTEAEWEYAARGPDGLTYPWGDSFVAENVVFYATSAAATVAVGSRPGGASWVGALDLSGNVWEWVSTSFAPYPYDASDGREDPGQAATSDWRVNRGGAWRHFEYWERAAARSRDVASTEFSVLGFRCARDY